MFIPNFIIKNFLKKFTSERPGPQKMDDDIKKKREEGRRIFFIFLRRYE